MYSIRIDGCKFDNVEAESLERAIAGCIIEYANMNPKWNGEVVALNIVANKQN